MEYTKDVIEEKLKEIFDLIEIFEGETNEIYAEDIEAIKLLEGIGYEGIANEIVESNDSEYSNIIQKINYEIEQLRDSLEVELDNVMGIHRVRLEKVCDFLKEVTFDNWLEKDDLNSIRKKAKRELKIRLSTIREEEVRNEMKRLAEKRTCLEMNLYVDSNYKMLKGRQLELVKSDYRVSKNKDYIEIEEIKIAIEQLVEVCKKENLIEGKYIDL